jgi:hypothetical protein
LFSTQIVGFKHFILININMGWLSRKKEPKFDMEKLNKIPIVNEKWIRRFFMLPIDSEIMQLTGKEFDESLDTALDLVQSVAFPAWVGADSIETKTGLIYKKTLKKNPLFNSIAGSDGNPYILIRFLDAPKDELTKKPQNITYRKTKLDSKINMDSKYGRSFLFSPIMGLENHILQEFETVLVNSFGLPVNKTDTLLVLWKNIPYVTVSDGVQTMEYPLEKRLNFHIAAPEFAEYMFGGQFSSFVEEIIEKKDETEVTQRYWEQTKKILNKHKWNY